MAQQDLTGFVQICLGMGVVRDGEFLISQGTAVSLLLGFAGGSPLGISPVKGGLLFGEDNLRLYGSIKCS